MKGKFLPQGSYIAGQHRKTTEGEEGRWGRILIQFDSVASSLSSSVPEASIQRRVLRQDLKEEERHRVMCPGMKFQASENQTGRKGGRS